MAAPEATPSLTQRLAAHVAAAILDHERVIERDGASTRSLHVEVAVARGGGIGGIDFWVEHHLSPGQLVGMGGSRKRRQE
jgi:hypothetical protein